MCNTLIDRYKNHNWSIVTSNRVNLKSFVCQYGSFCKVYMNILTFQAWQTYKNRFYPKLSSTFAFGHSWTKHKISLSAVSKLILVQFPEVKISCSNISKSESMVLISIITVKWHCDIMFSETASRSHLICLNVKWCILQHPALKI